MSGTCGTCAQWRLSTSPLRSAGMGLCDRDLPLFRGARTYSAQAPCCRPGEYVPATSGQVERRAKELSA